MLLWTGAELGHRLHRSPGAGRHCGSSCCFHQFARFHLILILVEHRDLILLAGAQWLVNREHLLHSRYLVNRADSTAVNGLRQMVPNDDA